MDRPPRSRTERLVDGRLLLRSLLWLGSLQTLLCFAGFFWLYWSYGYRDLLHLPRPDLLPYDERLGSPDGRVYVMATSMFHAGVVATQIGNAYACRTERASVLRAGFWRNRLLLAGFAFELVADLPDDLRAAAARVFEEGPLPAALLGRPAALPARDVARRGGAQGVRAPAGVPPGGGRGGLKGQREGGRG